MFKKIFGSKAPVTPTIPRGIQFAALPKEGDNLGLSPTIYDKFHKDINKAITEFNTARTVEARLEALKKMQAAIQYVDLHAPPRTLATAQKFHDVKNLLFMQIKTAYAENGVASLSKVGNPPVAQILSDMSPGKADRLMEILHKGKSYTLQTELRDLYPLGDTSPEANQWREFLRTHTIEFLGGGNSKNFKVTNIADGSVKVLKVDNRLGMARHVEQHLRGALGDVFTPIDADRQVKGTAPDGKTVSRTLLVTDLCTSGSVDEHSEKVRAQGQTATYLGASDIMGQMTQVFRDIQGANCMFPDSKLTNWLVDSTGKIRLADTKSFLFTQGGEFRSDVPGNENMGMLRTGGFTPSELDSPPYQAEKLHASLLGRNIYAYLTGNWPDDYELTRLREPIFKTPIGLEYKQLIQDLVKDPPSSRMSLADAQAKLQELGLKANPKYQSAIELASRLGSELGVDLETQVKNMIKADQLAGIPRETTLSKINTSLLELEKVNTKCDQLINKISDIRVDGKPVTPKPGLLAAKHDAVVAGASSIDNLIVKLGELEPKLTNDLAKVEELDKVNKKCNQLIKDIGIIQIDGRPVVAPVVLEEERRQAILGAVTPGDLIVKLGRLEPKLIQDLAKVIDIEKINSKCDKLIKDLGNFQIDGVRLIAPGVLQVEKRNIIRDAISLDDLRMKLGGLEPKLQDDLVKVVNAVQKYEEFRQLRGEIEKLKICDNDPGMKAYLEKCDKAILKDGKPDEALITAQMEKMRAVKVGLEKPENGAVKDIIQKYDKQKTEWFSRNMNVKARKIEGAMASIPIEERANLLQSKDPGVTKLLTALAWHRINPFANPINKEGKIEVSSSANTFKEFKERFKDKIVAREDVVIEKEQEHVAKPR